jgi:hypothetical protein
MKYFKGDIHNAKVSGCPVSVVLPEWKQPVFAPEVGHDPLGDIVEELLATITKIGFVSLESVTFTAIPWKNHSFKMGKDLVVADDVFRIIFNLWEEGYALSSSSVEMTSILWAHARLIMDFSAI